MLATQYLDTDVYERTPAQLATVIDGVRAFLRDENVPYGDYPNAVRTLALLQLMISDEPDPRAAIDIYTLRRDAIVGRVAASGPYSSVYAAMLALVIDELTVYEQLDAIAKRFARGGLGLSHPVLEPGVFFRTTYYRGQSQEWLPLPKVFRQPGGGLLQTWWASARDGARRAKFEMAVQRSRPTLNREQLTAVAQHYGASTPMLDFTESLEVAAYFATQPAALDGRGVLYRYHLVHPWAADVLSSTTGSIPGVAAAAAELKRTAALGLEPLRVIVADDVPRIATQHGVFVLGLGVGVAFNFMQPVFFAQHDGVRYEAPERGIDCRTLFPSDDALARLAADVLGVQSPACS